MQTLQAHMGHLWHIGEVSVRFFVEPVEAEAGEGSPQGEHSGSAHTGLVR